MPKPDTATFSPCRTYRYTLSRHITDEDGGVVLFIMLNPSTADEKKNDPTVRRTIGYATRWGASVLWVANIFAFRSTDPYLMRASSDPVGPDNDREIIKLARLADAAPWSKIVCAWGVHGDLYGRGAAVRQMLLDGGHTPHYLALTKDGHPVHPLYQKNSLTPTPWV